MLLTVFLFKPSVWNHTLAKVLCKLQRSGLTLVGLRVVTLDKCDANSLLSAENVTYNVELKNEPCKLYALIIHRVLTYSV